MAGVYNGTTLSNIHYNNTDVWTAYYNGTPFFAKVNGISNFKRSGGSYSNTQTFTFTAPGSYWNGIIICAKNGSWPGNVNDYTYRWQTSSSNFKADVSGHGNWCFRAWNYRDVNGVRFYGGYADTNATTGYSCSCNGDTCDCNCCESRCDDNCEHHTESAL